ncbi:HtaA domain-containing protein [Streptomyces bohaiensis]|uniref:HtaA domain-containing protein n=1 Tax=Streptomyces bohaiensis TaxID=1431344 RepID=UPI003B782D6B
MLPIPARRRVPLTGLLGVVLAALALALLTAPAAHASERTVSGGRLDWGVRASFLTYVTGPVAQGSWGLSGGAGTVGHSQFRFHSATGGYDPATGAVSAAYTGGVRFQGHVDAQGVPELDLTISNPSVRVTGASGTLHADIRSKARGSGQVTEASGVALASLDLSGVDLRGGSRISVTGAPATLTTDGAAAFAGYYAAGDPLDPVTFTADTLDPAPDPAEPAPDPAPDDETREQDEAADEDEEEGGDAEEAPDTAEITDAALDWGVRRTYREFVTGDIADGGWELADGAQDGGALFRFPDGTGELDAEAGLLTAAFTGSVHFAGNDLDLLVDAVRVEVADGSGTMTADVTTAAGTAEDQPLVTFEVPELAVEDGLFHLSEAPAELTAEGAEAFGGLYSEGTVMDPLTLAVAVSDDAELPPLPDLGSEPVEEAEPEPTREPEPLAAESTADDSSSTPVPLPAAAAIALLALAGAGYLVRRRTTGARRATTPSEDTDKETTER